MIEFGLDMPPEELALALAALIHPEFPVTEGVPFLAEGGQWYELSRANDHKLDFSALTPGRYTYRDRYREPTRMARVHAYLMSVGAEVLLTR